MKLSSHKRLWLLVIVSHEVQAGYVWFATKIVPAAKKAWLALPTMESWRALWLPSGRLLRSFPSRPTGRTWQSRGRLQGLRSLETWNSNRIRRGRRKTADFVGEQPGNDEDWAGRPFVGPTGKLLDKALEEVGIDRSSLAYVTNVVKHFKWEPRGKRRIHAKPNAIEIRACLPWLNLKSR